MKCMDIQKQLTADGTIAHQWWCWGGTNQDFQFVAQTDGTHRIVARHSGKSRPQGGAVDIGAYEYR